MNTANGWGSDLQRYLDGEAASGADERGQAEADRFRETIARYAESLELPGGEVDEAVMAAVRARAVEPARPSLWQRLWAVAATPIRPTLAAAAIGAALIGASAAAFVLRSAGAPRAAAIAPLEITVPVLFELDLPDAEQVNLAGTFNGWDAAATPLSKHPATGRWVATLRLAPGWHEYLFFVDGLHWIPDPAALAQVVDDVGDTSSAIYVGPP